MADLTKEARSAVRSAGNGKGKFLRWALELTGAGTARLVVTYFDAVTDSLQVVRHAL
jgi:hypothetical protein